MKHTCSTQLIDPAAQPSHFLWRLWSLCRMLFPKPADDTLTTVHYRHMLALAERWMPWELARHVFRQRDDSLPFVTLDGSDENTYLLAHLLTCVGRPALLFAVLRFCQEHDLQGFKFAKIEGVMQLRLYGYHLDDILAGSDEERAQFGAEARRDLRAHACTVANDPTEQRAALFVSYQEVG